MGACPWKQAALRRNEAPGCRIPAGRQEKGGALPKPSPCRVAGAGPAARPVHLVCASKEKLRSHQKEKRGAVHHHQLRAGLTPSGKRQEQSGNNPGKAQDCPPTGAAEEEQRAPCSPSAYTDMDCPANLKELHSDKHTSENTLERDI